MKKSLLQLLCTVVALSLLSSCNNTQVPLQTGTDNAAETDFEEITGDYIYRRASTYDDKVLLLKYNVHTGEVDTVCNDPYCTHSDESCPFWEPMQFEDDNTVYIGNTVFFIKEPVTEGKYNICAYSPEDMNMKYLYSSNYNLFGLFAYGQYLFFDEIRNPEAMKSDVVRLDLKTGEVKYIREDTADSIYSTEDGKIIWKSSTGYQSTGLDGKYPKSYNISDHFGYTYRTELLSGGGSMRDISFDVYRTKANTEEWELIASDIGPKFFINDKIIYFKPLPLDEQPVLNSDGDGAIYDYFGGNVYIMNLDGTDNHLLCHVPDVVISGMSPSRANELVCGDYVGIFISPESEEQYTSGTWTSDMLIVNIVTGEYVISRYGQ